MAKEKTSADVAIAEIKARLEHARIRHNTYKVLGVAVCVTVTLCWAMWCLVEVNQRADWLTLCLALIAVAGSSSAVIYRLRAQLKLFLNRKSAELSVEEHREESS
jgi:FtsH-binding integral membrane protein